MAHEGVSTQKSTITVPKAIWGHFWFGFKFTILQVEQETMSSVQAAVVTVVLLVTFQSRSDL